MRFLKSFMLMLAGVLAFLCLFAAIAHATITKNTKMLQGFILFADTSPKGVPASAYPDYSKAITDYLLGRRDDLAVTADDGSAREQFSEKELAHMEDVRRLVQGLGAFRYVAGCLALALVGLCWLFSREKRRGQFLHAVLNGAAAGAYILLGLVLALAVWGAVNFTGLFITFHKVFFSNDLWLLNPNRDLLIMLMPTRFFVWYAGQIGLACLPVAAVMAATIAAGIRFRKK